MKFSICIPNYNYARYLERTIQSVLTQSYENFEIIVSDNASTDGSAEIVRSLEDPRIRLYQNRCNIGFAGNLDRAASRATGDFILLLSSDDVMRPDALRSYAAAYTKLGERGTRTIATSSWEIIDENDVVLGSQDAPGYDLWTKASPIPELEAAVGTTVLRREAAPLLRDSLLTMQNPFAFCPTAYPRCLYEAVEGYGGGRSFGPDKWFHWRLLGAAEDAVLVRRPLFAYRWHSNNQAAQQAQTGALKYLIDDYLNTFEASNRLLEKAGISRRELEQAFVEYDVTRHGLALLSEGKRTLSRRTVAFGKATYPQHLRRNARTWILRALLHGGPPASWLAAKLRRQYAAVRDARNRTFE